LPWSGGYSQSVIWGVQSEPGSLYLVSPTLVLVAGIDFDDKKNNKSGESRAGKSGRRGSGSARGSLGGGILLLRRSALMRQK